VHYPLISGGGRGWPKKLTLIFWGLENFEKQGGGADFSGGDWTFPY